MIALLPSLIVALIIMIHERHQFNPPSRWCREEWLMFILGVIFWPIAIIAIAYVVVWPKLSCMLGNHKIIIAQQFSAESRRVHCLHCKNSFMMIDRTHVLPSWDRDWHEMYERHGHKIKYIHGEVRWR